MLQYKVHKVHSFVTILYLKTACSSCLGKPMVQNMGAKYAHNNVALCLQTKGSCAMWHKVVEVVEFLALFKIFHLLFKEIL